MISLIVSIQMLKSFEKCRRVTSLLPFDCTGQGMQYHKFAVWVINVIAVLITDQLLLLLLLLQILQCMMQKLFGFVRQTTFKIHLFERNVRVILQCENRFQRIVDVQKIHKRITRNLMGRGQMSLHLNVSQFPKLREHSFQEDFRHLL